MRLLAFVSTVSRAADLLLPQQIALELFLDLTALLACVSATWSPTIGDPGIMGWVTVAAYVASAFLTLRVCLGLAGRRRMFWLGLSIILLALALNKQLDLQTALTDAGRCLARAQGWYDNRRIVQIDFILSIMAASVVMAVSVFWIMRRSIGETWLALTGLTLLLAFIAVRAAGFHHFDRFIGHQIGGVRMNWIMELGAIAMISANALYLLLRRPGHGHGQQIARD